jgi:hypothetical protein
MFEKKAFFPLFVLCNICFLVYFLVLGYYNQPATDDYCILNAQVKYGINSSYTFWYQARNGRILPLYLTNTFLNLFQKTGSIFGFTLFMIAGFIFAIHRILNIIQKKHIPKQKLSQWSIFNIATFIFCLFVFNNFKFNTFYWLNASTMYFGGILFLLLGLGEILNNKIRWYSYPFVLFCFLYAGFSTENQALAMVMLFLGIIILNLAIGKKLDWNLSRLFYFATAILCMSFVLLLLAPGSQNRLNSESDLVVTNNSFNIIVSFLNNFTQKLFLLFIEIFLVYLPTILLSLPIIILISRDFISNEPVFKTINIWPFFFVALILIGICIAPTIFIFGFIGPQRVLTGVNAVLLILAIIICFQASVKYHNKLNIKYLTTLSCISLVLFIFNLSIRLSKELPVLQKYSQLEIQKRVELKMAKNGAEKYNYKNPDEFSTPTITETASLFLLKNILPNKYEAWKEIFKHEPILPNIVYPSEITIYQDCIGELYNKKIEIIK